MNYNNIFNNSTFDDHNLTKSSLFHQNIRGIYNKIDERLLSLPPNLPQIICITEHHLKTEQLGNIILDQYTLGTAFCRQEYRKGGACIYVLKDIEYNTINLEQYNKEKDLEICDLKIQISSNTFIIICIYRSPTGNFTYFLQLLEFNLSKLYKTNTELIVCGDLNVNYLNYLNCDDWTFISISYPYTHVSSLAIMFFKKLSSPLARSRSS